MKIRLIQQYFILSFVIIAIVKGNDNDNIERTQSDENAIQIPPSSNDSNDKNYEEESQYPFQPVFNDIKEIPGLRSQWNEFDDEKSSNTAETTQQQIDMNGNEIHNPPYNLPIGPEYDNLVNVMVSNDNGTRTVYNNATVYFNMETVDVHISYGLSQLEPVPSSELEVMNRQNNGMIIQQKQNIFHRQNDNVVPTKHQQDNILVNNKVMGDIPQFVPLSCNANLEWTKCTSWVSKFGKESIHSDLIVIECGKCYVMDFQGSVLTLKAGIDIVGKLVFPNGYYLRLVTSMIVVQGELKMTSTKAITGTPDIEVTMIGMEDKYFTARGENKNVCRDSRCLAGKKAITIAGGKLNGTLSIILANFVQILEFDACVTNVITILSNWYD
jgi:hypothetical protein